MMDRLLEIIAIALVCFGASYLGAAFAFRHGAEAIVKLMAKKVQEEELRIKRTKF